jgi:hypothetical protein
MALLAEAPCFVAVSSCPARRQCRVQRGALQETWPLPAELWDVCVMDLTAAALSAVCCCLRSVVCYFGHHYQTFVLSEELQQWLLFDDNVIQVVGDWQQVKQTMVGNRLQPSLLFYESADAAAA